MSSIPPALPPTAAASLLAQAATTATMVGATADLLTLLAATPTVEVTVDGTVGNPGGNPGGASTGPQPQPGAGGLLQVQTPAGPVLLKLSIPVPDGATLRLQVMNPGTALPPLLRLLSVNGQPVSPTGQIGVPGGAAGKAAQAGSPSTFDATRLGPSPLSSGASSTATTPAPPGFLATVVRAAGIAPGDLPAGRWALPAGTTFTVRIANLQLPAPSTAGAMAGSGTGTGAAQRSQIPADGRAMAPDLRATVLQAVKAYTPAGAAHLPSDPASGAGPKAEARLATAPPPATARDTASSLAPAEGRPAGGAGPPPAAPAERPLAFTPSPPSSLPGGAGRPATEPPPPSAPPAAGQEAAPPAAPRSPPGPAPMPSFLENPLLDIGADGFTALDGVVAPNSYAGRPLIQTPVGLLSLDPGPDLPPGTRIGLTLVTQPAAPPPPPDPLPASTSALATGRTWPALDTLMQTLHRIDPQAAEMLIQRLPDAGPRLAPAMMIFAAAVQSGSAAPLLGTGPLKSLVRAGRRDLVDSLEKDLGRLTTPVRLPLAGQWQSILLPLPFGPQIVPIRLIVRKPPEDDAEAEARQDEGSRFLLDVEMSRLGPLQLDGLVKRRAKRFDLMVRSHQPLAPDIRRDICGIFFRALDGLGMTGEANFQQAAKFIEAVPADLPNAPGLMI